LMPDRRSCQNLTFYYRGSTADDLRMRCVGPPLNGGAYVRHQVRVSSGAVYGSYWCSTLTKRFGGRG
jgi:hypothetical protein